MQDLERVLVFLLHLTGRASQVVLILGLAAVAARDRKIVQLFWFAIIVFVWLLFGDFAVLIMRSWSPGFMIFGIFGGGAWACSFSESCWRKILALQLIE